MYKKQISLNKRVGIKLKKAREKRGYSQGEFSRISGYNQGGLSLLETGKRNLTIDNLIYFSKLLNVSPMYFLSNFDDEGKDR